MKKILSLLLFLPLVAIFASCDDDGKDIPDVAISIETVNPVSTDGAIYVVQGDTLNVKGVVLEAQGDTKQALTTSVSYYFDYVYMGTSYQPPFGMKILTTEDIPVGSHLLEIELPVYAVDKEISQAYVQFPVTVVASEDELPSTSTNTVSGHAKTVQQK